MIVGCSEEIVKLLKLNGKIIGIIGSRRSNRLEHFILVLTKFRELYVDGDWICSGGCPEGGDKFAETIAEKMGIPILIFFPNWQRYGRKAGFIRNTSIAKYSDILIACPSKDRTGGTEDTIKKFLKNKNEEYLYLV